MDGLRTVSKYYEQLKITDVYFNTMFENCFNVCIYLLNFHHVYCFIFFNVIFCHVFLLLLNILDGIVKSVLWLVELLTFSVYRVENNFPIRVSSH